MAFPSITRRVSGHALSLFASAIFIAPPELPHIRPAPPTAALDTAIVRMGGEETLRKVERVRFAASTSELRFGVSEPLPGDGCTASGY